MNNTMTAGSLASISGTGITTGTLLQLTAPASTSSVNVFKILNGLQNKTTFAASISAQGEFELRGGPLMLGAAVASISGATTTGNLLQITGQALNSGNGILATLNG